MTAGLGQNPRMPNPATDPHAPPAGNANTTLRARFNAMRNLPPFLKQIWATSPWLTITSLGLRLVRALLPIVMLYIGKLIIDEAVRLVPPVQLTLESAVEFIDDDELVEITPKEIRLRKKLLTESDRKRASRAA